MERSEYLTNLFRTNGQYTGTTEAGPVQNGLAWRAVNFSLLTVLEVAKDVQDSVDAVECSNFICAILKVILYTVAKIIVVVCRTVSYGTLEKMPF